MHFVCWLFWEDEYLSSRRGKDHLCGEYWEERDGASAAGAVRTLWNGENAQLGCKRVFEYVGVLGGSIREWGIGIGCKEGRKVEGSV